METERNETVVEKVVNFVKDTLGMQPDPVPADEREYRDTAPEVTAEDAMRLDPNAFVVNTSGQITPAGISPASYVAPMDGAVDEADAERLRREVDEYPRQKTAMELNAESARAEDGE